MSTSAPPGGKRKREEPSRAITAAACTSMGERTSQEDRFVLVPDAWVPGKDGAAEEACSSWPVCGFFGVFDGHMGEGAAELVSKQLWVELRSRLVVLLRADSGPSKLQPDALERAMRAAFAATEVRVLDAAGSSGCTATVALIVGDALCIANLGDSRTVLCRSERCFWSTTDHKPDMARERARIVSAGGKVYTPHGAGQVNVPRLNGILSVSRAFGDAELKAPNGGEAGDGGADPRAAVLSAEPDVTHRRLGDGSFGFKFDEFLLLASDGLWDVLSGDTAVEIARAALRRGPTDITKQQRCQQACDTLVSRALQSGHCRDNVTVMLVMLCDELG